MVDGKPYPLTIGKAVSLRSKPFCEFEVIVDSFTERISFSISQVLIWATYVLYQQGGGGRGGVPGPRKEGEISPMTGSENVVEKFISGFQQSSRFEVYY